MDKCNRPNCDGPASMACGRCLLVRYCSKECQRADWCGTSQPTHRTVCQEDKSVYRRRVTTAALGRILGNAAELWNDCGAAGAVHVAIDENIDDFLASDGDLHCANMQYTVLQDDPRRGSTHLHGDVALRVQVNFLDYVLTIPCPAVRSGVQDGSHGGSIQKGKKNVDDVRCIIFEY